VVETLASLGLSVQEEVVSEEGYSLDLVVDCGSEQPVAIKARERAQAPAAAAPTRPAGWGAWLQIDFAARALFNKPWCGTPNSDLGGGDSYSLLPVWCALRQPEPRMRLAVRGVPKGALRTHSA